MNSKFLCYYLLWIFSLFAICLTDSNMSSKQICECECFMKKDRNKQTNMAKKASKSDLLKLFNVTHIKKMTPKYNGLKVSLKRIQKKGIGIVANKEIKPNTTILYYKLIVRDRDRYISPFDGKYNFEVYDRKHKSIPYLTADIFNESNQMPLKDVPFWGYFVNEPNVGQKKNVEINVNLKENYRYRDRVRPDDIIVYKFVSTRTIKPGEEITWCYGRNYKRNYKTSCGY